jgi:hypothetical protein
MISFDLTLFEKRLRSVGEKKLTRSIFMLQQQWSHDQVSNVRFGS